AVEFGRRGVPVEAGDEEVALLEERHVVGPVALDVGVAGDELVEVIELLVVPGIGDRTAVLGEADVRALMLEAPQRGVLLRGGGGIPRIDLDDVAEEVRLVLEALVGRVEPGLDVVPAARGLVADAVAGLLLAAVALEVLVEVLLAGEERAPGGEAAGAVAHRALDGDAVRAGPRDEQLRAARRAGELEVG